MLTIQFQCGQHPHNQQHHGLHLGTHHQQAISTQATPQVPWMSTGLTSAQWSNSNPATQQNAVPSAATTPWQVQPMQNQMQHQQSVIQAQMHPQPPTFQQMPSGLPQQQFPIQ